MNSRRATRLYNRAQRRIKREDKKLFNDCFKELKKVVFQKILEGINKGVESVYIWEDKLIYTAFDMFPKIPPVREILEKLENFLEKRGFVIEKSTVTTDGHGREIHYSNIRWEICPKQLKQKQEEKYKGLLNND